MLVESVSKGPWNECPSQRGIAVQVFVDWVSKCAWNPQLEEQELNELADQLMYRAYIPDGSALAPLLKIRAVRSNRQALVIWFRGKRAIIASSKEEGRDPLDCLEHELNLALMR